MFTKLEEDLLRQLLVQDLDLKGRRCVEASDSLMNQDYVTQRQLTDIGIDIGIKKSKTIILTDEAYGSSWNGSVYPPTKNAVYDEIQTVIASIPHSTTGTWSPTILFGGLSTGVTYNLQVGQYFTISVDTQAWVFLNGFVVLTSKGTATGNAALGGLPFVLFNLPSGLMPVNFYLDTVSVAAGHVQGFIQPLQNVIQFYDLSTGTSTALTDTNFTNTSLAMISAFYRIT